MPEIKNKMTPETSKFTTENFKLQQEILKLQDKLSKAEIKLSKVEVQASIDELKYERQIDKLNKKITEQISEIDRLTRSKQIGDIIKSIQSETRSLLD